MTTEVDDRLNSRLNDLYSFFALIRETAKSDPESLKLFVRRWNLKRLNKIYESVNAKPCDIDKDGRTWRVYILPAETLEIAFARTQALHSYIQSVL